MTPYTWIYLYVSPSGDVRADSLPPDIKHDGPAYFGRWINGEAWECQGAAHIRPYRYPPGHEPITLP